MSSENKSYDLIVIGGGAAGLMGAATAARNGAKVAIAEKHHRCGLKLSATGNGRCNLTNTMPIADMAERFGREWRFMLPAFESFDNIRLCKFFSELGVVSRADDGVHFFPESGRASDVVNALTSECLRYGVDFFLNYPVRNLEQTENDLFILTSPGNSNLYGRSILFSGGGSGYPTLGDGAKVYDLAEQLGHKLVKPIPAMCGLLCNETWPKMCAGTVLTDCEITLLVKGKQKCSERGEVLLTGDGISGPAVLDIAGRVLRDYSEGKQVELSLNLQATRNRESWQKLFDSWRMTQGKKLLKNVLCHEFNLNLACELMKSANVSDEVKICEITSGARDSLFATLLSAKLHISGLTSWNKAMVTSGGVSLKCVKPDDLSSKVVDNVFFAGEILNLDGPCGGYNLQWAFSSGYLAGKAIAKRFKN